MSTRTAHGRLFAHDFAIVRSALSQVAVRKRDLLTLLIAIPIFAFLARNALADLSGEHLALIALGIGSLFGFSISQLVFSRIRFHRAVGPLAHIALRIKALAMYAAAIACTGASILLVVAFALGLFSPGHIAAGAGAGALLYAVWLGAWNWFSNGGWKPSAAIPIQSRLTALPWRICIGLGLLSGATLAIVPMPEGGIEAASAGLSLAAAVLWGNANISSVKFMTLVGQAPLAITRVYIARPLAFILPMAAVLWAGQAGVAVPIAGAILTGFLLITALRVLSYMLYPRQMADWVVGIILTAAAMVALSLPFATPFFILASLSWLAMKARHSAWMIT